MTAARRQTSLSNRKRRRGVPFLEELRRRSVICVRHARQCRPRTWCWRTGASITACTSVKALPVRQEESRVTVMQADGLREYSADEIIDARPKITTPHLCTFLAKAVPECLAISSFRTLMKDLFVMRQRLFPACGYASARKRLREFWEDRRSLCARRHCSVRNPLLQRHIDNPVFELERGIRRGEE